MGHYQRAAELQSQVSFFVFIYYDENNLKTFLSLHIYISLSYLENDTFPHGHPLLEQTFCEQLLLFLEVSTSSL